MMPGTATPGEMEQAMSMGLDVVKFFPAEQNGGVAKLKALAGPYTNLRWMPTGGVNTKNLMDYLSFDKIVACGGTWMVKKDLIEGEKWDEITRICREAVKTMLGFELKHVGINCADEAESREDRQDCSAPLFGLEYKPGNSSVFCRQPRRGVHEERPTLGKYGHIAIGTNSVDRAMYHLGLQGVTFNESTRKTDGKGKTKAIYLQRRGRRIRCPPGAEVIPQPCTASTVNRITEEINGQDIERQERIHGESCHLRRADGPPAAL